MLVLCVVCVGTEWNIDCKMNKCSRYCNLFAVCVSIVSYGVSLILIPVSVSAMMAIGTPLIRLLVTDGDQHTDCPRVC